MSRRRTQVLWFMLQSYAYEQQLHIHMSGLIPSMSNAHLHTAKTQASRQDFTSGFVSNTYIFGHAYCTQTYLPAHHSPVKMLGTAMHTHAHMHTNPCRLHAWRWERWGSITFWFEVHNIMHSLPMRMIPDKTSGKHLRMTHTGLYFSSTTSQQDLPQTWKCDLKTGTTFFLEPASRPSHIIQSIHTKHWCMGESPCLHGWMTDVHMYSHRSWSSMNLCVHWVTFAHLLIVWGSRASYHMQMLVHCGWDSKSVPPKPRLSSRSGPAMHMQVHAK